MQIIIVLAVLILLALLIIILFINSRHKKQMDELMEIRQQFEVLNDIPVRESATDEDTRESESSQEQAVTEIIQLTEERQGAEEKEISEASAYNTGKSGKTYTKEELELLIKE